MNKPSRILTGQRWTFLHSSGARESYTIGAITPAAGGLDLIAQIVNDESGAAGWVTRHWLNRPEGNRYGWFVFDAEAPEQVAG